MIDNAFAHASSAASALERPRAFAAIFYGGLAVGILDGSYAVISAYLRNGVTPNRVFNYIASGLLGRPALSGGIATTVLGVLLHFLIAFGVATVYYYASLNLPMLIQRPLLWGPLYGVAVYFVMQFIVVYLSAAPPLRGGHTLSSVLNGILVHALLVGSPAAFIARWSAIVK
jgi:hypothetical protein